MFCRRAGDAKMNFGRTGVADHLHDLLGGRPAHDGVVDQDDALAFEQIAHRVELEPHAEVADALLRLDEGAAHIVVADQSHAERQARLFRVTHGSRHA